MTKDGVEIRASDKKDAQEPLKKGEERSGSCGCGCGGLIGSKVACKVQERVNHV